MTRRSRLKALEDEVERIKRSRYAESKKRLADLVDEVAGHNKRLDQLSERLAVLENDVKHIRQTVEKMEGRMWGLLVAVLISMISAIVGAII